MSTGFLIGHETSTLRQARRQASAPLSSAKRNAAIRSSDAADVTTNHFRHVSALRSKSGYGQPQYSYGFDSQTGEYVNLISKGIIDPTKVVRVAIQNAASVAALLITTEAMVAEVPKKNAGGGMPAGGGGMGGMDF